MSKVVMSVKHRPPVTVATITAILALLMGSKAILIGQMPISNAELKEALSGWFDWVLNVSGVIMGILSIFLGVKPDKVDTDNP